MIAGSPSPHHDLRRIWATYHLVERQVDVRMMMAIGGWSDYSAIEPYLTEPTERRIGNAMRSNCGENRILFLLVLTRVLKVGLLSLSMTTIVVS